jgi:hypothetical protein
MGAFEDMYNHFEKNMGNIGASRALFREPDPEKLKHLYKDDLEEAEKTQADQPTLEEILQAIKERKGEEHAQKAVDLDKESAVAPKSRGDYPSADKLYAQAYNILQAINPELAGDFQGEESPKQWGTSPNQMLERIHDDLATGELTPQEIYTKYGGEGEYSGGGGDVENSMGMQKMGPALSNLLSAAAGWALSADTASRDVPPEMAHEWERAVSREDKRRLQEEMLRRLHGKKKQQVHKSDDGTFLDNLHTFYKEGNPFDWQGEDDDDYDLDSESDPQWDAHAQDAGAHDVATQYGWGGKEPDVDDFHPESGERLSNHGQGAHDVRNWAKGVQAQTGVSLVNDLGEPHDAIYDHHGLGDDASVTAQHISDYVQNTTGQSVDLPGAGENTIQNMLKYLFMKDHAPVPPRYGLMWDAVKHRWTRPEKVGRTVWEVQGKKRLRGSGTGSHERSRSTKGSGGGKAGGSMEAGRRFRSVADAGRAHPQTAKRVGQVTPNRRKPVGGK